MARLSNSKKVLARFPIPSNKAYDKAIADLADMVEILIPVLTSPQGRALLKEAAPQINLKRLARKAKSLGQLQAAIEKQQAAQRKQELKQALDPATARFAALKRGPLNWPG